MDILTEKLSELRCSHCGSSINIADRPFLSEIKCPKCSTTLTVPAKLGPFMLLSLLGRGGMGAVYMARDESLNRLVALKVMLKTLGQDRDFVETFRREGQAAAALNHPNVVQIYSFGEEQGQPYMVMEMLSGGRLDKMIAGGKPLDENQVLRIGIEVAEGLKAANDAGLIHGDIKPENILMDNNGVAKVVDFGLASFRDKAAQREGVWGTPYYIAPEKVRGQRGDIRSDIYSLGATLFHALAARPPFEGTTPLDVVKARLETPAPDLKTVRPEINPELAAIVARMLEREPSRRYPTHASLLADMRKILVADGAEANAPAPPKKRGKIVLTKSRTLKTGETPAVAASEAAGAVAAKPKAKSRRVFTPLRIIIGLVVVLAIMGGSIGGCMHHRKHVAQKKAAAAEQAALSNAVQAVGAAFDGIAAIAAIQQTRFNESRARYDLTTNALAAAAAISAVSTGAAAALNGLPGMDDVLDVASNALDVASKLKGEAATVLEQAAEKKAAAAREKTSKAVLAIVSDLKPLSTNLEAIVATGLEVWKEAGQASQEAAVISNKVAQVKAAEDVASARAAASAAEAQRQAAAAAAAKAAAQAQQAMIEQDRATVKTAYESSVAAIKANEFSEALASFVAAAGEVKTTEGTAEFQIIKSRLSLLVDLKASLVKLLAGGYRWGWLNPPGDVTGASDKNVVLSTKAVPWNQVSPTQMMKFIGHFYNDETFVSRRERARMLLATAVFCYENSGMKPAALYAGKAGDLNSDLKTEAEKIMPELVEKKPEP